MAFEEVLDLDNDVTIVLGGVNRKTNKANPTEVEGYYLGCREVPDKKKKSGISYIYTLKTPKGNVGVWGKTDLDNKMQGVTPGIMIKIIQSGTRPTPNGDMYKFKVLVDKSNTIEVVGLGSGHPKAAEPYVSGEDEEQDEDEAYVSQTTDRGAEADERRRRTEELLSRKRK